MMWSSLVGKPGWLPGERVLRHPRWLPSFPFLSFPSFRAFRESHLGFCDFDCRAWHIRPAAVAPTTILHFLAYLPRSASLTPYQYYIICIITESSIHHISIYFDYWFNSIVTSTLDSNRLNSDFPQGPHSRGSSLVSTLTFFFIFISLFSLFIFIKYLFKLNLSDLIKW